jgi:hypothetical protein
VGVNITESGEFVNIGIFNGVVGRDGRSSGILLGVSSRGMCCREGDSSSGSSVVKRETRNSVSDEGLKESSLVWNDWEEGGSSSVRTWNRRVKKPDGLEKGFALIFGGLFRV